MPRTHTAFWTGLVAPLWPVLIVLWLAIALVHGCASNPVSAAQTLEQKAYATYGAFVIAEETAAGITSNPSTPMALRATIQNADTKAKPSADALLKAFQDYDAAQTALKTGTTSQDKVNIASTNLAQWIAETENDVNGLVSAIHSQ